MKKKLHCLIFVKTLMFMCVLLLGINVQSFGQNITVTNEASSTATERNNARLIATGLDGRLHVVYYTYC